MSFAAAASSLTFAAFLASTAPSLAQVSRRGFKIVETYPQDGEAFTQGLYYDGTKLYLGTGKRGASSARIVDLKTGRTLRQRNLPRRLFGEGLTVYKGKLYQLTWTSGIGVIHDAGTLEPAGQFRYATEGWGLTTNGTSLIMSDGTDKLTFLDPSSFKVEKRIRVEADGKPVQNLNELEYIDGRIFANIFQSDTVVMIDPRSGRVTAFIDFRPLAKVMRGEDSGAGVLNGIAYDKKRKLLLITGKNWSKLFAVQLSP